MEMAWRELLETAENRKAWHKMVERVWEGAAESKVKTLKGIRITFIVLWVSPYIPNINRTAVLLLTALLRARTP